MTPESGDFLGWILWILQNYGGSLAYGLWITFAIAVISTFNGCVIGLLVGLVQTAHLRTKKRTLQSVLLNLLKGILKAYVAIFRGTPMMVQAAFIYYGMAILYGVQMGMWTASIFIVSINTGAYMAETVRGGILSVDDGQKEAALAIGMSHTQAMRYVVLPQALRNIMPQIGNNLIINIKDTCVLSIIGISEFFYSVKSVAGATYAFFPAYTIAMIAYFILTFISAQVLRQIEKKMDGPQHYDLILSDPLVTGEGLYQFPEKRK